MLAKLTPNMPEPVTLATRRAPNISLLLGLFAGIVEDTSRGSLRTLLDVYVPSKYMKTKCHQMLSLVTSIVNIYQTFTMGQAWSCLISSSKTVL